MPEEIEMDVKVGRWTRMNVLFVCSQNRLRSPTGEAVFASHEGISVLSAGTNNDADTPVSGDLIEWADIIVAMEKAHRNRITKRFRPLLRAKRVVVLGIPDEYEYMDPELVGILKRRIPRLLGIDDLG